MRELHAQAAALLWRKNAHEHQKEPDGDWTTWLLLGGRGAGKTRAGAEWIRGVANDNRHAAAIALVAETYADAREVMIDGPSGIRAVSAPGSVPAYEVSRRRLVWPDGAIAYAFSAEDPDGIRGYQFTAAWSDEFAKWRYAEETWSNLQLALRLGDKPRQLVTTTPRPLALLKRLIAAKTTEMRRATTYDNRAHLSEAFFTEIAALYEGTALGRQELMGEVVDDVAGALWTWNLIEASRISLAPDLDRIVVAVDPPATGGENADECGIVVAGVAYCGDALTAFVLADRSAAGLSPRQWAERTAAAFHEFSADRIIVEVNQGGDMAKAVIAQVDGSVPIRGVHADRRYRLLEIEDGAARECSLARVAPAVYDAPVASASFSAPGVAVYSAPVWALMDLPLLGDNDDPAAPWFAAFSSPWPGGAALYRSSGGAPSLAGLAPARAVMGRLETALPQAGAGRRVWRELDVRLSYGSLSSREEEDLFAGANAFAVKSDAGGWEVCQFQNAELLESGAWRLTGLLRGQAGTEAEALAGAGVGARFVLLTAAVTQVQFSAAQRGLTFAWQAGPEANLPDTENFTSESLVMTARGLMPLAPVHLRAAREGDDIRLSWIRRARTGGDTWEGEVPLGELSERYRVTIFDGEDAVRTVETTAPEYLYAEADITADFGGDPGGELSFAVAQISDAVGEGVEAQSAIVLS